MIKVALTGNRYSGKNTAIKHFKSHDVPVFDSDTVLKFIINYNNQAISKIKEEFGANTIRYGMIDSQKFDTDAKLDRLFDIVEFDMIEAYNRWLLRYSMYTYTIFKSSILFERRLEKTFDTTINVFCPLKIRVDRYLSNSINSSNKWTVMEAMTQEMNEYDKNAKADYIIHNYDDIKPLDNQVDFIHNDIMKYERTGIVNQG